MKKVISLILLVSVFTTFAACGTESSPEDSTDVGIITDAPTTTTANRLNELGEKDFGKRTLTILDGNASSYRNNIPTEEQNGELVNDALYNRDIYIEELYNVELEYVRKTDSKAHTVFKSSILAGDDEYQMTYNKILGALATTVTDGVLANLADNKYLSLDREWWSPLMYDSIRLNGKMYFTTGDILPSTYQLASCMFYNTDLAEDYGIKTDLVTMVREGKWTLDELISMTKDINRDVDNDGVMHTAVDIFGLGHSNISGGMILNYVIGAGVNPSEVTSDGKGILFNMGTERAINTLEKVAALLNLDIKQDVNKDFLVKAFAQDRALFASHYLEAATSMIRTSGMQSDYLILPIPKYEAAQESYISGVNAWIEAFVALSAIADQDFVGFIAEAMAYCSYENIRPLAWDLTYGTKIARDDNTAEMLDIIFETSYVDFNLLYEFGGNVAKLVNVVNGSSLITELAAIDGTIKSDIDKLIENWG